MAQEFKITPVTRLLEIDQIQSDDVFPVVDVSDPTQATTGSTKKTPASKLLDFLTNNLQGSAKVSAKAATTGALTASYFNGDLDDGVGATLTNTGVFAAISIDGVALAEGERVLVKNQSPNYQNGIYQVVTVGDTLTPWVIIRASDYDNSTGLEISQGDFVGIVEGGSNALTFWFQTAPTPAAIGTDSIVFDSISDSFQFWFEVNVAATQMVPNAGYLTNTLDPTGAVLTLPLSANQGDIIRVQGINTGGWKIAQNAGQQIFFGDQATTLGVAGSIQSTEDRDSITLVCSRSQAIPAEYDFTVLNSVGNLLIDGSTRANSINYPEQGSGELLVGVAGSNPVATTLTAGTGIAIVNADGSITINSTAPTLPTLEDGEFFIGSTGNDPVAAPLTAGSGININIGPGSAEIEAVNPVLPALADGELYIGDTGNPPAGAQLTAGTGIGIDSSSGSIEIKTTVPNRVVAASGSVLLSDGLILVDTSGGDVTLTLPDAATNSGFSVTIKKISADSNKVIVSSVDNIDGDTTLEFITQYNAPKFVAANNTYNLG